MITQDTSRMATYSCLHCGVERPYGHGSDAKRPLLNCEVCGTQTSHIFVRNNDYVVKTVEDAEVRVINVTFERASRAL